MTPIFYLYETTSTNDEIAQFLPLAPGGCALYTFSQTKGRGQYGNRWENASGKNIAYSLALNSAPISMPGILFNYHTACAVRNFLAKMTGCHVEIKWPNDIILKRKKICGMLIERKTVGDNNYFITGIGINVLQRDFTGLPKAGSVFTQTGLEPDLHCFTRGLHEAVSAELLTAKAQQDILEDFNNHLFKRGEISVFEIGGLRQNGIIKRALPDGFLEVDLEQDGIRRFFSKQIEMLY